MKFNFQTTTNWWRITKLTFSQVLISSVLYGVSFANVNTSNNAGLSNIGKKSLIQIQGTVTDQAGEALPGATVKIKGTSTTTVTDANGAYTINASTGDVLEFSFIGLKTTERTVGSSSVINVVLESDSNVLKDVVVNIGYGTTKTRNVTGAVGRLSASEINDVPVVSLDQALTGRIAGVQVTENSAEPGGEISIKIRGIGSITRNTTPLIVIDGIPTSVTLNSINPNDIESIDIAKDASSSAIYGSRGSAGVIFVTTKRGKNGATRVNFDSFAGIQNLSRKIPLLNGPEWVTMAQKFLENGGQKRNPYWDNPANLANTDWQDAVLNKDAPMQNYNLSFAGGSEKVRSYFSAGYQNQEGILRKSDYKRITSRLNLDYDLSKAIKVGASFNYAWDKGVNPITQAIFDGVLVTALQARPVEPVYTNIVGRYGDTALGLGHLAGFRGYSTNAEPNGNQNYYGGVGNPVFNNDYIRTDAYGQNNSLLSTFFAEATILTGLTFKSTFGYNLGDNLSRGARVWDLRGTGLTVGGETSLNEGWFKSNFWNAIQTLNYTKDFGQHNISALVGIDAQKSSGRRINGTSGGFPENAPTFSASAITGRTTTGAFEPFTSRFSVLGRLNYNFADKYLLSATLRRDGSSRFNEENRWGYFPSVSAGWRISKENFMNGVSFLDDLKLRASYGSVGNDNIPDLQFATAFNSEAGMFGYPIGGNPTTITPGIRPVTLGNKNIKWERNIEVNFGLDASFFKGGITLSADYYEKKFDDLLGSITLPFTSAPFTNTYTENAFSMTNSGLELNLGLNKRLGEVDFSANANFSTLNNKVTSLFAGNPTAFVNNEINFTGNSNDRDHGETRTYVNERVGNFWGYEFDGIIQNQAELNASPMDKKLTKIGDVRYKDLNGDGKIDRDNDRKFLGNGLPGFLYGFGLNAAWKGFDLSTLFNGQGDVQIANMVRGVTHGMRFIAGSNGVVNVSRDLLNSWDGEGSSNTLPRVAYDTPFSNRWFSNQWVENGAFLRLRNVALGYTLPSSVASKLRMSRTRIYVSGQNIFTATKYTGYDPEVGSATRNNFDQSSRPMSAGVDFGRYPKARMYTFGISTQF
ncbi:MAG TPA: TonB-dependent receptor [Pedobacter sp.]|jgi:TonB-linked SusC/RagA family outer membrane protein